MTGSTATAGLVAEWMMSVSPNAFAISVVNTESGNPMGTITYSLVSDGETKSL